MRKIMRGLFRAKTAEEISLILSLSKGAGWYCNNA
jgi:hypothetical protein